MGTEKNNYISDTNMINLAMFKKNQVKKILKLILKHTGRYVQVVTPYSLTQERLTWMNFGGSNPKRQNLLQKSLSWFHMIGSGTIAFLMMPEVFLSFGNSVGTLAEDFLMGFGFLQVNHPLNQAP